MVTDKEKIEVFWVSGSPYAWRVLLSLELKKLPYESRLLEFSKGDTKTPDYLALNPRGKVPTLRHGDVTVRESLAILAYLERAYPQPAIFGETAAETSRVWQAIAEFDSYLGGPLPRVVRPLFFGEAAEKADDIRAAAKAVHEEFAVLDRTLAGSRWLAGSMVSAADIAVYPFLKLLLRVAARDEAKPLDLGFLPFETRYPNLAGWMKGVETIPGYARTCPPHWK
jgi:glutathione S-transferase